MIIQVKVKKEFLKEFITMLPKDKVQILEEDFFQHQKQLHQTLQNYIENTNIVEPLYESLESLNNLFKAKEN